MPKPPGGLTELDVAGRAAWDEKLLETINLVKPPARVRAIADADTPELTSPDWQAFPARIESCLTRRQAHELLDWKTEDGDLGRLLHQEEYLEWRVVRDADGRPRRIEMTTELAAYWKVLAAHQPERTLELIEGFAGQAVETSAVYGSLDPLASDVSPEERQAAFVATMLPTKRLGLARVSGYNNGQKAICCMIQGTNTLGALINLVAAAAEPHVVRDPESGRERFMSGSEAIRVMRPGSAQDCRSSDPVVVERVSRLAAEGRLIAFDDPIGIYIQGVERAQLARPDGGDIPSEWLDCGRGQGGDEAPDGRPRYQRLTLEVPAEEGFDLADLKVRSTDEPLRHGAQLAELVQVGVYVRMSAEGKEPSDPEPEPLPELLPCREQPDCQEVRASWQEFEASP